MEIPRAMALYIQLVVETISGPEPMPDPTELGHAVSSMAQPEDELEDDLVCSYAKTGNIDLLRKAAEQDDSLNDKVNDETGMTPLFFAVDRGHEAVVNFLLDKGAKINRQDLIGQTCLHVAAASGREILYNILVERGGDESVVDEDGLKPLDLFQ
jgi:ankyrin repeat protein